MKIPDKCKECMHRINDFCKGYGFKLEVLSVENCKRRKTEKQTKKKIVKHARARYRNSKIGFAGNNSNYMG